MLPAIATAPIQSLALGMGQATAPTLLPSPHPHPHMPVAEAQAALPLHTPQPRPTAVQGMPLRSLLPSCSGSCSLAVFHQLRLVMHVTCVTFLQAALTLIPLHAAAVSFSVF